MDLVIIMRFLFFLLLIIVGYNTAAEAKEPPIPNVIMVDKLYGNWLSSRTYDRKKDFWQDDVKLQSDNDILGNDPDDLEPLPLTLEIKCDKLHDKAELTLLYPNIIFPGKTQEFNVLFDKDPPKTIIGSVAKRELGNSSGYLVQFDEITIRQMMELLQTHHQMKVEINMKHAKSFTGKFSIDEASKALAEVKGVCMGKK